jgi:hypothetical protein
VKLIYLRPFTNVFLHVIPEEVNSQKRATSRMAPYLVVRCGEVIMELVVIHLRYSMIGAIPRFDF